MLFGLPAWAIIAIVAIGGGLLLRYREQELKMESSALNRSKEMQEMRKMMFNLKSRVEELESKMKKQNRPAKSGEHSDPAGSIEIQDESEAENNDNTSSGNKNRTT